MHKCQSCALSVSVRCVTERTLATICFAYVCESTGAAGSCQLHLPAAAARGSCQPVSVGGLRLDGMMPIGSNWNGCAPPTRKNSGTFCVDTLMHNRPPRVATNVCGSVDAHHVLVYVRTVSENWTRERITGTPHCSTSSPNTTGLSLTARSGTIGMATSQPDTSARVHDVSSNSATTQHPLGQSPCCAIFWPTAFSRCLVSLASSATCTAAKSCAATATHGRHSHQLESRRSDTAAWNACVCGSKKARKCPKLKWHTQMS